MANVIRDGTVVPDSWRQLEAGPWLAVGEDGLVPDFPPAGDLLVPVQLWRVRRDDLLERGGRLGLLLDAWDAPEPFVRDLPCLALVAVRIAQFTDGRAYSLAHLLRGRYGFHGELRAVGEVLRDQLFYLARCGFDAFALRAGGDAGDALASLEDFSESYQASTVEPLPLFRRRPALGAAP